MVGAEGVQPFQQGLDLGLGGISDRKAYQLNKHLFLNDHRSVRCRA